MRFDVVTILPEMFAALTAHGITGRAHAAGVWRLHPWNPRDRAEGAYRAIDDRPFGGGPGMVMTPGPLARTLDALATEQAQAVGARAPVVYLSPQGRPVTQGDITRWAALPALTFLCGRYEGVDQRLLDTRVDEQVAVGDLVVSGGELPAMMLMDGIVRWLPGAMNDAASPREDSFATGLLDCPHYTRPEIFEDRPVPPVLMSGHHLNIARWRRDRSLETTLRVRPELVRAARARGELTGADESMLHALGDSEAVPPPPKRRRVKPSP